MDFEEEDEIFVGFGGGCPIHGDEAIVECSVCGAEFCSRCRPGAELCEDCAERPEDELLEEEEKVSDEIEEDDEEAERLLKEADLLPIEELEVEESEQSAEASWTDQGLNEPSGEAKKRVVRTSRRGAKKRVDSTKTPNSCPTPPPVRARKKPETSPTTSSGKPASSRGGTHKGRRRK